MKISIYLIIFLTIAMANRSFAQSANIAGKTKGEITKEELLNSEGLAVDDSSTKEYHISSFRMALIPKGGGEIDFYNDKNGELTDVMRKAVKNAIPGNKIYIEYIKCINKNNESRQLSPLSFVIK